MLGKGMSEAASVAASVAAFHQGIAMLGKGISEGTPLVKDCHGKLVKL